MNDEPCTREHLRASLTTLEEWTVDIEGGANLRVKEISDGWIDGYYCTNCNKDFTPDKHDHIHRAWQAALDHLKTEVTV